MALNLYLSKYGVSTSDVKMDIIGLVSNFTTIDKIRGREDVTYSISIILSIHKWTCIDNRLHFNYQRLQLFIGQITRSNCLYEASFLTPCAILSQYPPHHGAFSTI